MSDNQEKTDFSRRRRVPRRAFEARIGLLYKGNYIMGQSLEIGEGGMLLRGIEGLGVDDRIVITFKIPEGEYTVVQGLVRYCDTDKACYGVEFSNLDFNVKRSIRTYVASKTAEEAVSKAS